MVTVRELMSTHLVTIGETDSLADARELMDEHDVRHLPVLDAGRGFAGLLTERDLLASCGAPRGSNPLPAFGSIPVHRVMNRAVTGVEPSVDARSAARHLLEHKHGCLPVVEGGQLVGLVTEADFVALAVRLLERDAG